MTPLELASKIDHTILKPEAGSAEVHKIVAEAIEHRFASVCVAGHWVARVAAALRGSGVKTCAVASFPHGASKSTIKAIEATSCIKDGADEIDVVAFLPYLLNCDFDSARAELLEIARAARAARRDVVIKVIVESAALQKIKPDRFEEMIVVACRAVRESGCDFIKTSTGFHPAGGACVQAVQLMKKHAQGLLVKAAGGIRDLALARTMLEAGADRLGLSTSMAILQELAGLD
jgi:deoxyribose-phosphate aldolase